MGLPHLSPVLSNNQKIIALETSLQQSFNNFQSLVIDMDQLHIESENYKEQLTKQNEKCNSNSCNSAISLKKVIERKDHIIQFIASALTKLNETKDFNILDEVFKIIFETPPKVEMKAEPNLSLTSPMKELETQKENECIRDDSISEIEGTPTGRTSPIIGSKKIKGLIQTSSDFRDKKKCPDDWPTPEKKAIKLLFPTPTNAKGKPTGRLRQGRLNIVKRTTSSVVDLTCSPEFSAACSQSRKDGNIQPLLKKESTDNDDTVLPSPTSVPPSFNLLHKSKESPIKFKKPPILSLKSKCDKVVKSEHLNIDTENKAIPELRTHKENAEDSINLLNPNRLPNVKKSPQKQVLGNNDTTYCDTQASVSLLQHVNKLDEMNRDLRQTSPTKQPLTENINITNIGTTEALESSMSILQPETKTATTVCSIRKRIPEFVEVAYKEAAPRKKAEKRMLPGWSCDECKEFFGELYKDDPVMLAKKIEQCSKHRGRRDPARPKTPPGYWDPKWELPEDTEAFNRRNNVA